MERLLEEISFDSDTVNKKLVIDEKYVDLQLEKLAGNEDLSRYIL